MVDLTPGFNLSHWGPIPYIAATGTKTPLGFGSGSAASNTPTGPSASELNQLTGQTMVQNGRLVGVTRGGDFVDLGPANGGGGSTATAPTGGTAAPALNQAAIDNTQKSIDALPGLLKAALAAEDQTYGNTNSAFDAQQAEQQKQYDTSSTTNQQNYDSNYMDAIRAGIHGLSGLFALLRGTGAGGGTADQNVRDIVGSTTANDIRTGADTRDQNQTGLDASLSSFLTDLKQKRQANADTHANNEASIRSKSNSNLQDLYSKMAGFYSDAGDTSAATDWMNRAGNLTPQIAADSRSQVSKYDTTPVIVHAPNLTAFAAPTQPSVTTTPSDGQVGSGIFAISPNTRKDKQQTPATQTPVLAGA